MTIAVYVFGSYIKYVPYFVYGINRSYPDYKVKIFVREVLTDSQRATIKGRCEIIDGFDPVKPAGNMFGGFYRAVRFIIPYEYFRGSDYVYIGDVDMLIVREDPPLKEAHINHMQKTGLCFSNQIRKGTTRLTGLHFFETEPYYEKMQPVIQRCINDPLFLQNMVRGCARDEHFLYNIVEQGIGFGDVKEKITAGGELDYRPHHGAHIGLLRSSDNKYIKDRLEAMPDYLDDMIKELGTIAEIDKLTKYV